MSRLTAKIGAYTYGQKLNRLLSRPLRYLADLLVHYRGELPLGCRRRFSSDGLRGLESTTQGRLENMTQPETSHSDDGWVSSACYGQYRKESSQRVRWRGERSVRDKGVGRYATGHVEVDPYGIKGIVVEFEGNKSSPLESTSGSAPMTSMRQPDTSSSSPTTSLREARRSAIGGEAPSTSLSTIGSLRVSKLDWVRVGRRVYAANSGR